MGISGWAGLVTRTGPAAGFADGLAGVESNATVLVVGVGRGSCVLGFGSSLAAGASEVYLPEEGAVMAALPGEGLELLEESVAAGSEGMGADCCWVDLRPRE